MEDLLHLRLDMTINVDFRGLER